MPSIGPIKRRDLIICLHQLGFSGPHPGKRHEFMKREHVRISIPNPHRGEISREFLLRILKEAGVSREQWEAL
jgi:predicted RNA binding protein YcfA (HicA-like mRNA interferase family)